MKNNFFVVFIILLLSLTTNGQKRYIQLENKKTGNLRTIKENKRLVIVTNYNQKIKRRFKIINENQISIHGEPLNLEDIDKIKKQSIFVGVLGDTFIGAGALVVLAASATFFKNEPELSNPEMETNELSGRVIGLATGFSLVGIGTTINIIGNSKNRTKWNYKIVIDE